MRLSRGLAGVAVCLSVVAFAPVAPSVAAPAAPAAPLMASSALTWRNASLAVTPRVQWEANFGYCGETSLVTAGLRAGQYTSQWTARSLASPGVPQTREDAQLLLGVNDVRAARAMRLQAHRFVPSGRFPASPLGFASWMRHEFTSASTVIIGVFNNTTLLGEPGLGDREYDHIVPVFGFASQRPLRPFVRALPSDQVMVSDNGLATVGSQTPMLYSYRVGDFAASREQVHGVNGPLYALPLSDSGAFYGLAVDGPLDPTGVLAPVVLDVSTVGEGLQPGPVMSSPPPASDMMLTARVPRLDPARQYRLYVYDDFASVPVRDFNAASASAVRSFLVPAGSSAFEVSLPGSTAGTYVFRAVPTDAP